MSASAVAAKGSAACGNSRTKPGQPDVRSPRRGDPPWKLTKLGAAGAAAAFAAFCEAAGLTLDTQELVTGAGMT